MTDSDVPYSTGYERVGDDEKLLLPGIRFKINCSEKSEAVPRRARI